MKNAAFQGLIQLRKRKKEHHHHLKHFKGITRQTLQNEEKKIKQQLMSYASIKFLDLNLNTITRLFFSS